MPGLADYPPSLLDQAGLVSSLNSNLPAGVGRVTYKVLDEPSDIPVGFKEVSPVEITSDIPPGFKEVPASEISHVDQIPQNYAKPEADPSYISGAGHGFNRGIAGVLGLPVDVVNNAVNLTKAAIGTGLTAAGFPDLAPQLTTSPFGGSQSIESGLNAIGQRSDNPAPDNPLMTGIYNAASFVPGALIPGKGVTAPQLLKSAIPAAIGGGVGSVVSDNPAAPMIGSMVPTLGNLAAQTALKAGLRTPQLNNNLNTFQQAGITPSVGDATQGGATKFLFNKILSRQPGSAGAIEKYNSDLNNQLENSVKDIVGNVSPKSGVLAAGNATNTGIQNFVDSFKTKASELEAKTSSLIPADASVDISNTKAVLNKINSGGETEQPVTDVLRSDKLRQLETVINKVAPDAKASATMNNVPEFGQPQTTQNAKGTLYYQTVRSLRSQIGAQLGDATLVTDIPRGQLKQLYAALTEDLRNTAEATSPEALKAFDLQSKYYSKGMSRIENNLAEIEAKAKPEQAFANMMSGTREGSASFRATMKVLAPDQRNVVTATVLDKLGRATATNQNAESNAFSGKEFLKNYSNLSPISRNTIFPDSKVRANVDALAKAAELTKDSYKAAGLDTPANVLRGEVGLSVAGSVLHPTMSGVGLSVGIPVGAALASKYLTSKMVGNPETLKWLADSTKIPANMLPAHLTRLGVIANRTNDPELKGDISNYIDKAKTALQSLTESKTQ